MKSKLTYLFSLSIITGLLLGACGSIQGSTDISLPKHAPDEINVSMGAQVTAIVNPTEAATPIPATAIIPVTGNNQNNDLTMMLVFALVAMAGLAFVVALVAVMMSSGRPSSDATTRPPYDDTNRTN
jgi:hypothetical protein